MMNTTATNQQPLATTGQPLSWEEWQKQYVDLFIRNGWNPAAFDNYPWDEIKELYFEEMTPEEAHYEELIAGL